jgi:hypothetical protein
MGDGMTDDFYPYDGPKGKLTIGGTAKGEFETAGDSDWFKVSLVAGTTYLFSLEGAAAGAGTLAGAGPFATLSMRYDYGGEVPAPWFGMGGAGGAPVLPFTPAMSGDYYVQARTTTALGTYTIKAAIAPPDDQPNNTTTKANLAMGATGAGTLDFANDRDWFRVQLTAGELYAFTPQPASANGLAGPLSLYLYTADGVRFEFGNTGGGPLYVTALATGAYFVEARSGLVVTRCRQRVLPTTFWPAWPRAAS